MGADQINKCKKMKWVRLAALFVSVLLMTIGVSNDIVGEKFFLRSYIGYIVVVLVLALIALAVILLVETWGPAKKRMNVGDPAGNDADSTDRG